MNSAVKLILALLIFSVMDASAHARWAETSEGGLTPARSSSTGIKSGPCGDIEREADSNRPATILQSGSNLNIKIYQDIYHQGDYRVYFSQHNDEGLFEYDRSLATVINTPLDQYTLIGPGELPDVSGQAFYNATITLPDIECDNCVLQMIQYMPDNSNNPYYYSCADIILTANGTNPIDPIDTTPPSNIRSFTAQGGDKQALLRWVNPEEDYAETLILQSDQVFNSALQEGTPYLLSDTIGNATLVHKGRATSQTINSLSNGSTYFFSAVAVDANLNYSNHTSQVVTLNSINENQAPTVDLIAEQSSTISTNFTTSGGFVIVQASVQDANAGDTHNFNWAQSSSVFIDLDNDESTFTFSPSTISTGTYTITVEVNDDGEPSLSGITTLNVNISEVNVVEPPIVTTPPTVMPPEDTIDTENEEATAGGIITPYLLFAFVIIISIRRQIRTLLTYF